MTAKWSYLVQWLEENMIRYWWRENREELEIVGIDRNFAIEGDEKKTRIESAQVEIVLVQKFGFEWLRANIIFKWDFKVSK